MSCGCPPPPPRSAALKLGLADSHPSSLCNECEVSSLGEESWPLCAELEGARRLFEANATSRSSQQWTMNVNAFERLLTPCLQLLDPQPLDAARAPDGATPPPPPPTAAASSGGGGGGGGAVDLRSLFAEACALRRDVGSGWDAPSAGQMTLWGFTEAMLRLAETLRRSEGEHVTAAKGGRAHGGVGGDLPPLAPQLARLVAAAEASSAIR